MPLQVKLMVGPGADVAGMEQALRDTLARLAANGTLEWHTVAPPTEVALRQQLAARSGTVLHMAVEAAAVGSAYVTLRVADAAGAPRSLNVQVLASLLKQAAPSTRLVVLHGFAGAKVGPGSPHELAAKVLVTGGVAAVVTLPPASTTAAAALYRSLANGDAVGTAVAAANSAAEGPGASCHGEAQLQVLASLPAADNAAAANEQIAAIARLAEEALARLRAAAIASAAGAAPNPAAATDRVAETLSTKRRAGRFDVFLCHNSADKPAVRQLGQGLKARGILPWLDEWELPPGQAWQALLERQIQSIASAAVCIGPAGISPWHQQEMRGFISEFVDRQVPVIPVLLPGAPAKPQLPLFLKQFTWVDFRLSDPDPFRQLVWGITGQRGEEG